MVFKVNGTDITANWVGSGISQVGATKLKESGQDLAHKYLQCNNHGCGVNGNPVCEGVPSEYDPEEVIIFWTGDCV